MSALVERLHELGQQLASEQDRVLAQDLLLGHVRARFIARSPRPALGLRRGAALGALVAVAAAAALYGFTLPPRPLLATLGDRPLAVGEWVSATDAKAPHIHFSDGSDVALTPGSRARLATLDALGAHLVLESGAADVRVTPHHGARYRISLGPFAVDVTGTRFDVGFRPSDEVFTLSLHEGKVVVSGCMLGEGRTLLAGESLTASCRSGHFEISAAGSGLAPSATPEAAPGASAEAPEVGSSEPEAEPAVAADAASGNAPAAELAPSWQQLARQGRFAEAYSAVSSDGFSAMLARTPVSELALLGDTARFAGQPGSALEAYQALRARGAGSQAAKQAAFSIARVQFDQRGAYAEAARWFRTYLAEQPGGPLAREAEGRLMESLARAGERGAARQAAERYLARYPGGPHQRMARQLLGR